MVGAMENEQPMETFQKLGDVLRRVAARLVAAQGDKGATTLANGRQVCASDADAPTGESPRVGGNSGAAAGESRRPAQGPKARASAVTGGSPAGSDNGYASPGDMTAGNEIEFATLVAPGRTAGTNSLVQAPQFVPADHQHTPPMSAICAAS